MEAVDQKNVIRHFRFLANISKTSIILIDMERKYSSYQNRKNLSNLTDHVGFTVFEISIIGSNKKVLYI